MVSAGVFAPASRDRDSAMLVKISFSCAAYPFTVSTRFGIRSLRRSSWFCTSPHAPLIASSCCVNLLYEQPDRKIARTTMHLFSAFRSFIAISPRTQLQTPNFQLPNSHLPNSVLSLGVGGWRLESLTASPSAGGPAAAGSASAKPTETSTATAAKSSEAAAEAPAAESAAEGADTAGPDERSAPAASTPPSSTTPVHQQHQDEEDDERPA